MGKKSILLINQSTGYLMLDIVNGFARSGKYEKVVLITGQINIRPTIPDETVRIIKIIKYNNKSFVTRFFTWLVAFVQILFTVLFKSNQYELFLVSNPPLTTFIPLFTRKKFSLLIYDIYPDSLITQKFLSDNSFIIKKWKKTNKKVFARAQKIFTISKEMKKVITQYVEENKIEVIYNWAHNEHIKPIKKQENLFLLKYELSDKLIVLYSGNMGITHDIDIMVDVAEKIRNDHRICFVFIGEGSKKEIIEEKIKKSGLSNCLVLPFQELSMLPYSLGSADISVVTTDSMQTALSVPSKTYSYLSVGSALLCLAEKKSELGRLVENEEIGKCFAKNEIIEISDFILQLANDKALLQQYKNNSRQLSFSYAPENANKFVELLNS